MAGGDRSACYSLGACMHGSARAPTLLQTKAPRAVEVRREQIAAEQREQQQSFLRRMMRAVLSVRRAQVQVDLGAPGAQPTSSAQTPESKWLARQETIVQTTAGADALAAGDDELTTQQLEEQINDLRI